MLGAIFITLFALLLSFSPARAQQPDERARTVIPHAEGEIVILSERQERAPGDLYIAEGRVEITYRDAILRADRVEYYQSERRAMATGNVLFMQGLQRFSGSRAEYNFASQTGKFYDVSGFTDREFFIRARYVEKIGPDRYLVEKGFITACHEAVPKWSFTITRANIDISRAASLRSTTFRIKQLPLLFIPYLRVPLERERRASGFLLPSTGTSTTKGRRISEAFYLVMGESADAFFFADYFSERGFGLGGTLRARPNDRTTLELSAYGVNDRKPEPERASGVDFKAIAETTFDNGFRAVADVDLVTNFRFRQVFSDSFRAATNSFERSVFFLTRNFDAFSFNFLLGRQETFFPVRSAIVRRTPLIEFKGLGRKIGSLPLYFYLDSSIAGLKRSDRLKETPQLMQRFDLFPRLSLPLQPFAGLSLAATFGVRETFWSDSLEEGSEERLTGRNLNREYLFFELAARGPALGRSYRPNGSSSFKHVVSTEVTYRLISGIDEFARIVRFDERDAVADSNEIEYALVNRLFVRGGEGTSELLSFKLAQKYFFDRSFGGAFAPGRLNQFYPLYTITPYLYLIDARRFSPLIAQLRFNPTPSLSLDLRADYDASKSRWRDASLTGLLRTERVFLAGTYFITRQLEPINLEGRSFPAGSLNTNQLQAQIGYGSTLRGFAASLTISYDIQRRQLLNSVGRLHYNWDCCGVAFEFQQFDVGLRVETQFRFSFTLKGIGSFGTLRRPEDLF